MPNKFRHLRDDFEHSTPDEFLASACLRGVLSEAYAAQNQAKVPQGAA
jgi:hypothetical protein